MKQILFHSVFFGSREARKASKHIRRSIAEKEYLVEARRNHERSPRRA